MSRPPAPCRHSLPLVAMVAVLVALMAPGCSGWWPPGSAPDASEAPPPGTIVWRGDFETGDLSQWRHREGGLGAQAVADDRIRVVESPTDGGSYAARFEVRQGDHWRGSGGNRAELMHWTGEGEGDERWYSWSTMFPEGYPTTEGFQVVTQWHADQPGTQPPVMLEVAEDMLRLKTVPSDADGNPGDAIVHWSAPIERGRWHRLALRVRWSSDPRRGRVELWRDGERVVEPTAAATLIPGRLNYLKQGLYRDESIEPTAVVLHDGMTVAHVR